MAHLSDARRRQIGVVAIGIGVIALVAAGINLLGGGEDDDVAAGPSTRSYSTTPYNGSSSTGDDKLEADEPESIGADGGSGKERNLSAGLRDYFTGSSGPARVHTVTISVNTSTPIRYAYAWRDKDGPGEQVTESPKSATRTFRTSLPAAIVALQLSGLGGTASCTITIDGVQYTREVTTGPYEFTLCIA